MGKKVNPIILRISNIKNSAITWNSRWIVRGGANFAKYLQEDERIRRLVKANVGDVGLDKILIERSGKNVVEVIIKVAKPGGIIGHGGWTFKRSGNCSRRKSVDRANASSEFES